MREEEVQDGTEHKTLSCTSAESDGGGYRMAHSYLITFI